MLTFDLVFANVDERSGSHHITRKVEDHDFGKAGQTLLCYNVAVVSLCMPSNKASRRLWIQFIVGKWILWRRAGRTDRGDSAHDHAAIFIIYAFLIMFAIAAQIMRI